MQQLYAATLSLLSAIVLTTCSCEPSQDRHAAPHVAAQASKPPPAPSAAPSVQAPEQDPAPQVAVETPPDPYEGWEQWCAPRMDEVVHCEDATDCPEDPFHPGKRMRCVHPWWAASDEGGDEYRECHPARPRGSERRWRKQRLQAIVKDRCRPRKGCDREALTAILQLEALKESSYRPWARHRLNADLEANATAYWRMADYYGHELEGRRLVLHDEGNRHYRYHTRWRTGLGYFGMNAAGFAWEWSPEAPPEVLCREEVAVEVWLRRARRVHRKLTSGIDCDRDPANGREFHGTARDGGVSWYDLHNGVNVGKLCPTTKKRQAAFVRRAQNEDLDPWATVSAEDLGEPVERSDQLDWSERITAKLDQIERP